MPLVKLTSILKEMDKKNTAALAFDCFNYDSIEWVIEVGEELNLPVIIMLYPEMSKYMCHEAFAAATKAQAKKVKIPVALHQDHCQSYETIMRAIKAGFTSVMFDGSKLPYEENVRGTGEIVKVAHAFDVDVEAELGRVGIAANKGDFKNEDLYTTVDQAVDFINKTKADALAIAIGSAHGYYVETPHLDMKRLHEINKAIDTPLVLHGGTGIPEDQLKQSFKLGINKLNLATEYFALFYATTKDFQQVKEKKDSLFGLWDYQKKMVTDYLRNKFLLTVPETK
ncbi:MAG: class II fructose-bisphosphate aldolase [Dehalococcoidales bacterium]